MFSNEEINGETELKFTDLNILKVKISEKFIGERGNKLFIEEHGFWRWLGIQYVVSESN